MIDQQAGFFAGFPFEGEATLNPVVVHKVPVTVGIAGDKAPMVPNVALRAEPNPFGSRTAISYQLGRAGSVALTVHDVHGRAVRRLADGPQPTGTHSASWDGKDDRGRTLPTGIYFCTLDYGARRISGKVVLAE